MPPIAPQRYESEALPYSARDLLTVVFKRRWLILAVLVTVVTVFSLIAFSKPRIYNVHANLLVNAARAEMPIAPTESSQLVVNRVSEEDLNSEIEVVKSRKLLEDVVRRLNEDDIVKMGSSSKSTEIPATADSPGRSEDTEAKFNAIVMHLQARVNVSQLRKSNILQLSYSSRDPVWATRVVKTLTDEYLSQRADRYQVLQAVVFFEQQMKDAQKRLKDRQQALENLVDELSVTMVEGLAGSGSLAEEKGLVLERLSDLESRLGSEEIEMEFQRSQVASIEAMMLREPERLENPNNIDGTTDEIERAIASLKLERDALLQDFRPDSRHVQDIDMQIEMAEDRLQRAKGASSVSGTEANPLFLSLKSNLLSAQAALEGSRARVASLRLQVSKHRKELDALNARAFEIEGLHREARAAEEDYLLYRKKHEEARISVEMDKQKFINVTVAQPAQMPRAPEPRGLVPKLLISILLGLLSGVVLAFVVDTILDRSFTSAEEVEKRLGIPHIASIPDGEAVGV